jgi:hypothetical protein
MMSEAVCFLFLQKSIFPEKKGEGRGPENPVYNNDHYGSMQMNCRVDVILYSVLFQKVWPHPGPLRRRGRFIQFTMLALG